MKCDILISGVGGQGQVLASRLLGAAAIESGFDVRTSETIGMSQRGGSVVSSVRICGNVLSPAVPAGQADLIFGFEICETVRILNRLSKNGAIVLNTQIINPVSVSLGMAKYNSEKMIDYIKGRVKKIAIVDACTLAEAAGSVRAANVAMLGAACGAGFLPFDKKSFLSAVTNNLPQNYVSLNLKAFENGYNFTKALNI